MNALTDCPTWCEIVHQGATANTVHALTLLDRAEGVITVLQFTNADGHQEAALIRLYTGSDMADFTPDQARTAADMLTAAEVRGGRTVPALSQAAAGFRAAADLAEQPVVVLPETLAQHGHVAREVFGIVRYLDTAGSISRVDADAMYRQLAEGDWRKPARRIAEIRDALKARAELNMVGAAS